ncbi:unnamed protein product [Amoebophrya sp. A120]|nr:unnamed protein product [Amoebophrya sp. A120]|eukprot:GSA120T00022012001.1
MAAMISPAPPGSFAKYSWVRLQNLQSCPELNGRIGQVFDYKFNEEKQVGRFEVFVPELDGVSEAEFCKAFEVGYGEEDVHGDELRLLTCQSPLHDGLATRIFPALTDEKYRKKVQAHKLLKPENLIPYEGQLVTATVVHGSRHPPSGKWEEVQLPLEHPIFSMSAEMATKGGNSGVLNRFGVPLMVVRLPTDRTSEDREMYQNQVATFLKVPVLVKDGDGLGFAPLHWQDFVGPVVIFRPCYHAKNAGRPASEAETVAGTAAPKHFTELDLEVVWEILYNYVEDSESIKEKDLTPAIFEKKVKNYLSAADDWNRKSMAILNDDQSIPIEIREQRLLEHQKTMPGRGPGERFFQQNLVPTTEGALA